MLHLVNIRWCSITTTTTTTSSINCTSNNNSNGSIFGEVFSSYIRQTHLLLFKAFTFKINMPDMKSIL